jgi:MFS family permease
MAPTTPDKKKAPLITPLLAWFLGSMILANISGRMFQPILPLYLQSLGASVNEVGIFFTIGLIVPLFFQILGGWLSDMIGRLQAIALGSIAGVIGYGLILWAPTWQWMLLAYGVSTIAGTFVGPSFQAFIAEQSKRENFGRMYGISEGLFVVVGVIGPLLGGFLSDRYSYKTMFMVAALGYLAAACIRIFMGLRARNQIVETHTEKKVSFSSLKKSLAAIFGMLFAGGIITWIFITDGVRDVSFSLIGDLQPIYMRSVIHLTNTQIGLLSSLASLVTMLLMAAAGWLSDKKGERIGIVGGFAIIAIGIALIITLNSFIGCIIAFILIGIGEALISPAYNSLISKVVPTKLRGIAFGLFSTSLGLVSLPAPYLGSLLYTNFGASVPFIVPIVAIVIVLPVMWIKFKLPKSVEETEASPAK